MYPLVMPANARHRREPSARQRLRGAIGLLALLALIAAIGIFGASLGGGEDRQVAILEAVPVPPRIFGWATYALPLFGLFCLLAPTRLRIVRAIVALLILVPSTALMALMSKPRGVRASEWAVDPVFARAQEITSYALMGALFLWAFVAVVVVATRRVDEVSLKVRRSILWAGPLTIIASLAVVLF